MKEESILYNGEFLLLKESDTKIFLHASNKLTLIHLVEGSINNFKRRLEFKKRNNDPHKYITFSYYITPKFVFSGELIISSENIITGDVSFQFLKDQTKILDAYYITIEPNIHYIKQIITNNITQNTVESFPNNPITLKNIEIFLLNIIRNINNTRCIKNELAIPYHLTITRILNEETRILSLLENLITSYPQIKEFLEAYNNDKEYIRILQK